MTGLLDKLNLSPSERRLVVIIGLVVFVVLNVWLVWPRFGSVGIWEQRRKDALKKLQDYKNEVAKESEYKRKEEDLKESGVYIATDDQALALSRDVATEASKSGVVVLTFNPMTRTSGGRTNQFFEEQTLVIRVSTGEKELVDFLYNLGAGKSLIRVKSMSLSPEPARMKLQGDITLVESFQKKPQKAPAPAPAATNVPARVAATTNPPPKTSPRPAPPKT